MPDRVTAYSQDDVDPEDVIRFDQGGGHPSDLSLPDDGYSPPMVSARTEKFTSRTGWRRATSSSPPGITDFSAKRTGQAKGAPISVNRKRDLTAIWIGLAVHLNLRWTPNGGA
jgi:hypothetical protein